MRCYSCREKLPFTIQQAYKDKEGMVFEIQCLNPKCRKINVMSQEMYLLSRYETFSYIPKDVKRTTKLPSEMNVIFVSIERCGISWIVRRLNRLHEILTEKTINYAPEISRLVASRERFDLPQGWFCVYDINPRELLKRRYDRIICIQRPKWVMRRVLTMYYRPDLTYDECKEQEPAYIEKINRDYDKYYEGVENIQDSRFMHIHFDDLNNYTEDTFLKLMDFLEFPKVGLNKLVPVFFPVNPPDRNWQAYSTTLKREETIGFKLRQMQERYGRFRIDKDEKKVLAFFEELKEELKKWNKKKSRLLNAHLREVQEIYENGMLEIDIQKEQGKKQEKINIRAKPTNNKIPKTIRFEKKVQNGRKFRLYPEDIKDALDEKEQYKILIITPIGYGIGCHLGEHMAKAFHFHGHKTHTLTYQDLIKKKLHIGTVENPRNISEILKAFNLDTPTFIFVNEIRTRLFNDTNIPVFNFHTGWYLPLGVYGKNVINYFRQAQLPEAYNYGKRVNKVMFHAVDPEAFYPEEKTIKGVCGIGFRKPWKKWQQIVGSLKPFVEVMEWETNQFIDLGYQYFHTPIDDHKYRELLRKMEALNPLIAYGEYITRRMLEAFACKTLLVYRLDFVVKEDGTRDYSVHRNMLESMGIRAGEHFIEIKDNHDIEKVWNEMTEDMKEEMREKAYKLVLERHTHKNRALQILEDFESGEWRNGEN